MSSSSTVARPLYIGSPVVSFQWINDVEVDPLFNRNNRRNRADNGCQIYGIGGYGRNHRRAEFEVYGL
jgi:hypothetical protein